MKNLTTQILKLNGSDRLDYSNLLQILESKHLLGRRPLEMNNFIACDIPMWFMVQLERMPATLFFTIKKNNPSPGNSIIGVCLLSAY